MLLDNRGGDVRQKGVVSLSLKLHSLRDKAYALDSSLSTIYLPTFEIQYQKKEEKKQSVLVNWFSQTQILHV